MSFTCEVRVSGRVGGALQAEFEELGLVVEYRPAETVLWGPVVDEAAVYGLVRRIEALGLDLVELRRSPSPVRSSAGSEQFELPPS